MDANVWDCAVRWHLCGGGGWWCTATSDTGELRHHASPYSVTVMTKYVTGPDPKVFMGDDRIWSTAWTPDGVIIAGSCGHMDEYAVGCTLDSVVVRWWAALTLGRRCAVCVCVCVCVCLCV